ncbi:MMPL family transporter [Chitinimonas koreensis]|uniref:MMPL family transporter n=1 Tax=Chitinimonas koreensis TaxID=356302 RepID=UPI0003FA368E|nr:MMPL family transporter [Chitinimonas koreensis]
MLAVVLHQVQFWRAARLDTDVLALLPVDEQAPAVTAATRALAEQATRPVVVLVGAADWPAAQRAAKAVSASLDGARDVLEPGAFDGSRFDAAVEFYRPWRDRLLTADQRDWLAHAGADEFGATALMQLYQPGGGLHLGDWRSDPLGLWPAWWTARAAETRARPRDGLMWLEGEGRQWVLLGYQRRGSAFAVGGDTPLADALDAARAAAAQAAPGSRLLAAGVPLHAEAAAARASFEINTIGYGSLAAVLLLVWLTFRSLRPIVLVGLSLLIGCAVALSVTALLFERVHLLTLVFGASLVGVAEDYGFHYFAARQGRPAEARWGILGGLLPGLALALLTSTLAYLALGLAPFPGLRQMAVFSSVGLAAAFLTVLCWFPAFDRGELPLTRFSARFADTLGRWPRWRPTRGGLALAAVLLALMAGGLARLESRDDLRQLQGSPAALIADQVELGRLLGLPSPAQFYLLEGADPEQVLLREEALKARLDRLVAAGKLTGYRAVSDWLPSQARQRADAGLTAAAERAALAAVAAQAGEAAERPAFAAAPLAPADWLAGPAAPAIRGQWLGELGGRHYSVLLLRGLSPELLPRLAEAGQGLAGVRWVDKTAEISSLLARYRSGMAALLLAGYAAVFAALAWRFRRAAWRALLPTVLGSLATLAIFGWLGLPLQLFGVLALVLLLGMGVDYGIFLLEHPGDGTAWLAVALAGVSTLLSFGLLALSSTPALRAFGLTMLLGELLIWLVTPCFRLEDVGEGCERP